MKLTKTQVDALNIELTVLVDAADYSEIERKKLADCRRRADFKGFRKGMVPPAMIKKIYGDQILADSVNQVLSEQINKFIEDEKLHILGEPLSSEKQKEIEWVDGGSFEFIFDIATAPEVKVEVSGSDTLTKYEISAGAKEKKDMAGNLKKYYESRGEEKTPEEIDAEVEERMQENYKSEADWQLTKDIKAFYVKKAGIELPEAFLKRWLVYANDGKVSKEDVEKEFPGFVEDFKWQMVRGNLFSKFGFKMEQTDIEEAADSYIRYQYAMYGMSEVPEDLIAQAKTDLLNDRKQIENLVESVEQKKVLEKIKETITVKTKKITSEKFREL